MSDFWRGAHVLITGHAGFLGTNLSRRLLDMGAEVIGFDAALDSPSLRALNVRVEAIHGDVCDLSAVRGALAAAAPTAIFHLAGLSHIAHCQKNPWPAWHVNVMGTAAVLEACRLQGISGPVVCASSNHVYIGGRPADHSASWTTLSQKARKLGGYGLMEPSALGAVDVYGTAKLCADSLVRCYRESFGLKCSALRHVNAYGPADPHVSHIVTATILSVLRGERPVIKSDGTPLKAYLHSDDVVSAYLAVAEHGQADLRPHAFNATSADAEVTVIALVQAVIAAAGSDLTPIVLGEDLSQSGYQERLDASMLESLGWRAQIPLYDGLRHTVEWYRAHGGAAWLTA